MSRRESQKLKIMKLRQAKLNSKVDKWLRAYEQLALNNRGVLTLASAAATIITTGSGVLALAPIANAEVVFTPANQVLNGYSSSAFIDFNHDGVVDAVITVSNRFYNTSGCVHSGGILKAWGQEARDGFIVNKRGYAAAGRLGQQAGPENNFARNAEMAGRFYGRCPGTHSSVRTSYGPWKDNKQERFLGVKFLIGPAPTPNVHYGWIRMKNTGGGYGTLTGYAYETIPNKPIIAGLDETGKPFAEPVGVAVGGLGRLAAGAHGRNR